MTEPALASLEELVTAEALIAREISFTGSRLHLAEAMAGAVLRAVKELKTQGAEGLDEIPSVVRTDRGYLVRVRGLRQPEAPSKGGKVGPGRPKG